MFVLVVGADENDGEEVVICILWLRSRGATLALEGGRMEIDDTRVLSLGFVDTVSSIAFIRIEEPPRRHTQRG